MSPEYTLPYTGKQLEEYLDKISKIPCTGDELVEKLIMVDKIDVLDKNKLDVT